MNKEATPVRNKEKAMKMALELLGKLEVRDTMLERQHGLSRMTLGKVRAGIELRKDTKEPYFDCMMGVVRNIRDLTRKQMDDERHRMISMRMLEIYDLWHS